MTADEVVARSAKLREEVRGPGEWHDGHSRTIAPTEREFPLIAELSLTERTLLGQVRLPVCKVGGVVGASRGSAYFGQPKEGEDASEVVVTVRYDPGDGGVLDVELEYL